MKNGVKALALYVWVAAMLLVFPACHLPKLPGPSHSDFFGKDSRETINISMPTLPTAFLAPSAPATPASASPVPGVAKKAKSAAGGQAPNPIPPAQAPAVGSEGVNVPEILKVRDATNDPVQPQYGVAYGNRGSQPAAAQTASAPESLPNQAAKAPARAPSAKAPPTGEEAPVSFAGGPVGSVPTLRTAEDLSGVWNKLAPHGFVRVFGQALGKLKAGDYAGLKEEAMRLQDLAPERPEGDLLLAEALNGLGKYKEAEANALEALRKDPKSGEGYEMWAWAQLGQGKLDEALGNANRAIKLNDKSARAYFMRALAYEGLGERDLMLEDLRRAAELDPAYRQYLDQALAGTKLFDPSDQDTTVLGDKLPLSRPGRAAAGLGVLLLLAALAGGAFALRAKPASPAPGQAQAGVDLGLLAGKYKMLNIIGRGASGEVWEARDQSLQRVVAVKKVSAERAGQARAMAALSHPNIVALYDILDQPPESYLVFERVAGKSVREILDKKKTLPLALAKQILKPVCLALAFARDRGIAHQDLKLSSMLVTAQGQVKLLDFGRPSRGLQTAPNRDVSALGACLYEMLTGERLSEGAVPSGEAPPKPSSRVPGLPPATDALIEWSFLVGPGQERAIKEFLVRLDALPA